MRETTENSRLQHEESLLPDDGRRRKHCIFCRAEKVSTVTEDGRDYFECGQCGGRAEQRIMLDPETRWN
jgi:transcription elongation factor Elf1